MTGVHSEQEMEIINFTTGTRCDWGNFSEQDVRMDSITVCSHAINQWLLCSGTAQS